MKEKPITLGRLDDDPGSRKAGKKPDYILLYNSSFPIAVVGAMEEARSDFDGGDMKLHQY